MNDAKIIAELGRSGCIAYDFLIKPKSLKTAPHVLGSLLDAGKKNFKKFELMPSAQATFQNIVEPLLTHDQLLSLLYSFIDSLNSTDSSETTRAILKKYQPQLTAYGTRVEQSEKLYALLKRVAQVKLSPDQRRCVTLLMRDMEYAGVNTSPQKRKKIAALTKRLATLAEKFENTVIDGRKGFYYAFQNADSLGDMPESDLHAAQEEAQQRKIQAQYVFTLSPPSLSAVMRYCTDRSVRELFYKKANTVAAEGVHDNRGRVLQLLKLRHAKARLMGYATFMDYVLMLRMAPSVAAVKSILKDVAARARLKAKNEIAELKSFSGLRTLAEWDVSFYGEKLRKQRYDVDDAVLRPYFPIERVTKGLFTIVQKLFGLTIRPTNMRSYHPEVKTYEVFKDGKRIAYYIADFFARPSKRGGAWCNDLRRGSVTQVGGTVLPIIINVMNFSKPTKKLPSLLSHRDVETLFHEFGHALHAMLSSTSLPNLTGFSTEWDFVEFPSQFFENWCWDGPTLKLISGHYKTGAALPRNIFQKLLAGKRFMAGYKVMRQLEFAMLDTALHTRRPPQNVRQLDALCSQLVARTSVLKKWPGYRMYASFGHIFAGGYAAGYYSYMWAEILEAECAEHFAKRGLLNGKEGARYAEEILAPGARRPGLELFKKYIGHAPKTDAFLRKHGMK